MGEPTPPRNRSWYVNRIDGPIDHWTLVPRRATATDLAALNHVEQQDWFALLRWLRDVHQLDGWGLAVHPGPPLTAHVIAGRGGPGVGRFDFTAGQLEVAA